MWIWISEQAGLVRLTKTRSFVAAGRSRAQSSIFAAPLTSRFQHPHRATARSLAPLLRGERLSLASSGFWLPWGFVSQDRVEDSEQLACDRDGRHEFGLAGGDELVAKELQHGVVS